MKNFILCITFLNALHGLGQPAELKQIYDAAVNAYKEKNYELFYNQISEAGKLHPYHQGILYLRGKASALTGRKEEAILCLRKAVEIYGAYPLAGVADFDSIKESEEFKSLLLEQTKLNQAIVRSDTGWVIKDRSLHAEGIAYDPAHKLLYLGSIHKRKIIVITTKGEASDFCPTAFEGMTSVFGVRVDSKRKILWACSSPMPEMENYDTLSRSYVFKFDLTNGKLLRKFQWKERRKDGIFGDLVLSANGEIYVSDSKNNQILKVDEKSGELVLFYSSLQFWNIQGMAFSPKGDELFISDYIKGIFRFE